MRVVAKYVTTRSYRVEPVAIPSYLADASGVSDETIMWFLQYRRTRVGAMRRDAEES